MSDYRLGPDETFYDIYEAASEDYEPLKSGQLPDQVILEVGPLVEELESLWPMMPKVNPDGTSECPFAEDLYRRKEDLELKIQEKVKILQDMRVDIAKEIERCTRNLSRVGVDATRLSTPQAREKYDEAWGRQENEFVAAKYIATRVDDTIHRAQATLAASGKKKFPLDLKDDLQGEASSFRDDEDPIHGELDELLSLGALNPTSEQQPPK